MSSAPAPNGSPLPSPPPASPARARGRGPRSWALDVVVLLVAVGLIVAGVVVGRSRTAPPPPPPRPEYHGVARALDKVANHTYQYQLSVAFGDLTRGNVIESGWVDFATGRVSAQSVVPYWPDAKVTPDTTYVRLPLRSGKSQSGQSQSGQSQWVAVPSGYEWGPTGRWTPMRVLLDVVADPSRYVVDERRVDTLEFRGQRVGRSDAALSMRALQALATARQATLSPEDLAVSSQERSAGLRFPLRGTVEALERRGAPVAFVIRDRSNPNNRVSLLVELGTRDDSVPSSVWEAPADARPYAQWRAERGAGRSADS